MLNTAQQKNAFTSNPGKFEKQHLNAYSAHVRIV